MQPNSPQARDLAAFALRAKAQDISAEAREALKLRIADGLGCALGARGADAVAMVRRYLRGMGDEEQGKVSLVGGGSASPDRAALYNGFLVRYLDFNDSYLAPGETCHPSDNIAPVLAAAEHAGADGATLLSALAVAYQVQCRLSDVAPVRDKGFDHTVQGSYAVAAGVSRALGLTEERAMHAIAIAGTAFNALRVTRTGTLSHWKGLAYPNTAFCAVHATYLAREGLTGPPEVFEGTKGFMDSIAGHFELDWRQEDLEAVQRTIVKKYNAEIHSQSVLEALEELRGGRDLGPDDIEQVEIEVFDVAHDIIGGGAEGDKMQVETKEQADHSLPYMAAAMLLDGEVTPRQYTPERIQAGDVRCLMERIEIRSASDLSSQFPDQMPCRVRLKLAGSEAKTVEKEDYEGFRTRPATRDTVVPKFTNLGADLPREHREALLDCVFDLENRSAAELADLLRRASLRDAIA